MARLAEQAGELAARRHAAAYTSRVLRPRRMRDDDVLDCLELDPGYTTDWAWQLERQEWGDETGFRLRPTKLPRPRTVDGFPIVPPLEERLEAADFSLLLEDAAIAAYVLAKVIGGHAAIDLLVVGGPWRRTGLGTRLVGEVRDWARRYGVRVLEASVEARNAPAIRFLGKQGFTIRGVRDVLDRDDEVTLLLAAPVG
jgi:GNAT superfamily N-acetyltransferase